MRVDLASARIAGTLGIGCAGDCRRHHPKVRKASVACQLHLMRHMSMLPKKCFSQSDENFNLFVVTETSPPRLALSTTSLDCASIGRVVHDMTLLAFAK